MKNLTIVDRAPSRGPWSLTKAIGATVIEDAEQEPIAVVLDQAGRARANERANARLMAAGPTLITACHAALDLLESRGKPALGALEVANLLRIAIAAAEEPQEHERS